MLHLVSTHAHIISYVAWLGITCYPYFRTVGFLRKWIRWPTGFNLILHEEQNTYLTFTDFEAISPLYWWANIFTYFTTPPYFNLLYLHSFKELQYKYNKKFWNFQIFLLFFAIFFCAYSWIRTNALPYPYGRFLCLSGLTDSISNISRHYFDSSVVSCSVYASNLYRQIIVGPPGLEPGWRDYESRILNLWITGPISFSKNFNNTKITKKIETSK